MCQVCWQGWGQAGLCERQRFLSDPGTRVGLPSPPPTATPRPSHLGGAAAATAAAGEHASRGEYAPPANRNTVCQPTGIRSASQREYAPPANGWCWSPASRQRSHVQLSFPHCKLGLLGSLTADWVVDLSGPEQLPPAISANKRPLSSRVEQGTGVERAVLLLRN